MRPRRTFSARIVLLAGVLPMSGAVGQDCDWEPLGSGVAPAADACAVLPNGDAVYGGRFSLAGAIEVDHVARWDGSDWHAMGDGLNNFVRVLLALPDGDVIAGGHFTFPMLGNGGLVDRWDGAAWQPLGMGLDAGSCRALARTASGDLIAGGSFIQADNLPAWGVARWDGSHWSKIGNNTDGGGVSGHFGVQPRPTMVHAIVVMPNGDIIVGGDFTKADDVPAPGIARWDGDGWQPLGTGTSSVVRDMLLLESGDLLVTGLFTSAGGETVNGLARWDGSAWHPFGTGLTGTSSNSPFALAATPDGGVVLGGAFDIVGGVAANNIAAWDPDTDTWSALGSGMLASIQTTVLDIAVDANGVIYASGQFASAGGNTLARNAAVFECRRQDCAADLAEPFGVLDLADVQSFIAAFTAQQPLADLNGDGVWDLADVQGFVASFLAGCP